MLERFDVPPGDARLERSGYEDNIQRSIWLTLLRDRLRQIIPRRSPSVAGQAWSRSRREDNEPPRVKRSTAAALTLEARPSAIQCIADCVEESVRAVFVLGRGAEVSDEAEAEPLVGVAPYNAAEAAR